MLDKIPNAEEMTALIGQSLYDIWNKLCALIDEKYDMECLWNKGGKAWTYSCISSQRKCGILMVRLLFFVFGVVITSSPCRR